MLLCDTCGSDSVSLSKSKHQPGPHLYLVKHRRRPPPADKVRKPSAENKMSSSTARDPASNQLLDQMVHVHQQHPQEQPKILVTSNGAPVDSLTASMTAGPLGPIVLQDFTLIDHLARFDRERIPERVVHAKGAGARGYFQVCDNPALIQSICKASVFAQAGKQTPVAVRFSTVGGESGSADTARDPRGFAIKLFTDEGNWDLVGNNTPIFFLRDPTLFPR